MQQAENITIIRSKRKTVSIEIKPAGILVRAPLRLSKREIYKFLREKEDWINKHQEKIAKRQLTIANQEPITTEQVKSLMEQAKKVIPKRVSHYASILGVDYGRITIRCQKTRWGSCTSQGNLNFNCLLMLAPVEVLDSVVVHELCHRKHMNHSAAFYNEVYKVYPEYKRYHGWLKEHGAVLLGRVEQSTRKTVWSREGR